SVRSEVMSDLVLDRLPRSLLHLEVPLFPSSDLDFLAATQLETLDLFSRHHHPTLLSVLSAALPKFKALRTLELDIIEGDYLFFSSTLSFLPNLTSLALQHAQILSPSFDVVCSLTQLRTLHLGARSWEVTPLSFSSLSLLQHLESLILEASELAASRSRGRFGNFPFKVFEKIVPFDVADALDVRCSLRCLSELTLDGVVYGANAALVTGRLRLVDQLTINLAPVPSISPIVYPDSED